MLIVHAETEGEMVMGLVRIKH